MSFDLLGSKSLSYGSLKFEYSFKTHYYFIGRCTVIVQIAEPMLSRVTWPFLKLLVVSYSAQARCRLWLDLCAVTGLRKGKRLSTRKSGKKENVRGRDDKTFAVTDPNCSHG